MIPGPADGGRDRHVDRPLDDRRHPGRQAGPAGPRIGPREHLAPDRRRARNRDPDHARHLAHEPPDRHGRRTCPRHSPRASGSGFYIGAGLCAAAALATFVLLPKPAAAAARRVADAGSPPAWWSSRLRRARLRASAAPTAPPLGAYTTDGSYSFVTAAGPASADRPRPTRRQRRASSRPGTSSSGRSTTSATRRWSARAAP